ncbi:MAG TPA: hypothetical protein VKE24_04690 [Candidatus Acidoferrales bacterium]|nr:hypothetical protein [Candidatus Acidoferrales bacterium]
MALVTKVKIRAMAIAQLTGILMPVPALSAQVATSSAGVPVHMVVTVEPRHGKDVPLIHREDVKVYQGHDRALVKDWLALRGDHAGLELFLLLDDGSDTSLGSQLEDFRKFINAQPATTAIAVGYMRNGTVDVAQNFTTDHALAAKALRLPLGSPGVSASPYFSLVDLIKRWPAGAARHEVLMVSDGIDRFYGGGPSDPYVDSAIEQAQRAGVLVYTIYAAAVGHFGHSLWRLNWGQNNLARLADQTGGEAYFQGFQTPIAFAPYLEDLTNRLNHQYVLTFLAKAGKKAGFQRVKLETEVPNAELVAAEQVFVRAGR